MSRGVERLAEQQRFACARRQQTGQHLHGRGLAAAVRADEAEYFAALDGEVDPIDGGEIAEAAGQVARDDTGSASTKRRGGISSACVAARAALPATAQ